MQVRRVLAVVTSTAFLVGTGFIGMYNGITEWGDAVSPWEKAVTSGVFLYGVLGLPAGVGLLLGRAWSYKVVLAWAATVTVVAGGAVRVYGDGALAEAAVAAIATLVVASVVAWLARHVLVTKGN